MTTFIFTRALNAINSRKEGAINAFNSSPVGEIINYLQPKTKWKKDKISGRLSEISIQTSTYSKVIPMVYGKNKLAGNVLWLGTVQEVVNNNTTSVNVGKGQKIKQTSIDYFYFLSFAIAICAGEIASLENVWADTTLLNLANYSHRFYSGTSTQLPDTLIESVEGSGNVSAYRDISYIVFENFPLSEFNNRIPNFLFEVVRKNEIDSGSPTSLENCLGGINIVPPCGEYTLNTTSQYKAGEQFAPNFLDTANGLWYPLNRNNNSGSTDSTLALSQLTSRLANCQWFSVQTAFFGNSLDISSCTITPRVSFNYFDTGYPIFTAPDPYHIGSSWNRYNSPMLGTNYYGSPRFFSGSSSDESIVSFFQRLKSMGKNTVFHPKILMDMEGIPSSKLLSGNITDIANFFTKTNGYNAFILHYANLLKDYLDVFLIGSELTGLTSLRNDGGGFPAVDSLIDLAGQVRTIVGSGVKISYAAGYREYHSVDDWYALDKLWASNYIDFVGINAYFPLTNSPQDGITKDSIKNGWFSGEGYDYITVGGSEMAVNQSKAYKNMNYWWSHGHTNPNGTTSNWIPESKKIWFTEYGFRSLDCSTNEPYKGVGSLPKYSSGSSDFYSQRIAIEATEEVFANSAMVERKLVYCWDIRPYPFFPNRTDLWPDGSSWQQDYCLNGKTGISNANVLIYQLFKDADIDEELIENVNVDEFIDGFVINDSMSVRDALYLLQKVYFFDCVENGDKISFISTKVASRNSYDITEIYDDELIASNQNNSKKFVTTTIAAIDDMPKRLSLIFLDKNNNYDTTSVYAERICRESNKCDVETLPMVLDLEKARNIAEISLYSSWLDRIAFDFILPLKYLYLNCSDLIKLQVADEGAHILKIKTIVLENNVLKIHSTEFNARIYEYIKNELPEPAPEIVGEVGDTNLRIFEIPAISLEMLDKIYVFFALNGQFVNWPGANLYFSNNNRKSYESIGELTANSMSGRVINSAVATRPYYFDNLNRLRISFHGAIDVSLLENIDDLELYGGKNRALYANEIIQFKNIVLNPDGSYSISGLLRGLYGTEEEIYRHKSGDKFLILNNNLLSQEFSNDKINFEFSYKAVTFDRDISKAATQIYSVKGKNLEPLAPCHFKYKLTENILTMNWESRRRGYRNWTSGITDDDLGDTGEKYYLEIFREEILLDKISTNERQCEYIMGEDELAPTKIKLCQINDLFGRGKFLEMHLFYTL
ncbi:MAG: glycoside hydrolase TIM-barrel-like domain-containing protein [Rickettsiales bacterium]|jgi:hypothetical protein|nr:glycoside hydrolase TIM-barrel-like domain-containing protein [Rickettsiales bacterium]